MSEEDKSTILEISEGERKMTEKKKSGKTKRVLKWFALSLLAILTVLALIFQAPWKVTALLVIFLLACTILPKPYRKFFWLSVGAVVLALIIWVFLPEDNEGWQPYKYNIDKELAALEAKYAIPEEENAATIYNNLLQDHNEQAFYANLPEDEKRNFPMREPWLSKDHPEIAEWLQLHKGTIEKLFEASKIEKCLFPIVDDTEALCEHMEILAPMRRWAFLLVTAANNDLAEGRTEESLQKNLALLKMGKHMCQQPHAIDWLIGTSIEALTINQFKTFTVTGDTDEEHLNLIEHKLTTIKHDWSNDFLKILTSDKLSTKTDFASRFYEVNPKGKIRLSRDPWDAMRTNFKKQLENNKIEDQQMREFYESFSYLTYWQRKLIKAYTIRRWFYIPSNPQKAAKIIDYAYEKYYAMAEPDFDWQKEPREFSITSLFSISVRYNYLRLIERLALMNENLYYNFHQQHLRSSTDIQGSKIIIALRRYKNKHNFWPESLDEIKSLAPAEIFVDPMNGDSFVYKLTEENFTLYSKGKNNIDEGGKYKRRYGETSEGDDWLIWPRKLPETKEKNITNDGAPQQNR